jgi:nicotinate-nucleotide adenylyltransferase
MQESELKYRKKTGLFFGSFNPVHAGHLIIANYFLEYSDLEEIWFIVSPHNPLKEKKSLLPDHHRYAMVQIAVEDDLRMRASNFEFNLPKPSYTIDTLIRLEEKYPGNEFIMIAGSDIFPSFHKWKNYEELLKNYHFYIYSRPSYGLGEYEGHPHIRLFNAPMMEISASFIRQGLAEGKDLRYFFPCKVYDYLKEMHFYEK